MSEKHGPDCTCGCHDHEHEHEHEHEHGHEHHHEHGHHHHDHGTAHEREVDFSWASVVLESHVHDQAATVSATVRAKAEAGKTFGALVAAQKLIAQHVESTGGIVGHIKAYVRAGESFAHASVTDAQHAPACEGDAGLVLGPDVQCQLVAIALLVDLDVLEEIVLESLA